MLNVDSKNAEIKLRSALTTHHSIYGDSNVIGYRQLYSQYPTSFEGMSQKEMIEVADAVLLQALTYKDKSTSDILSPILVTSKYHVMKESAETYLASVLTAKSAGEKLFTKEDLINALYYGKYQI